jgi:hypothetical protein
MESRFAWFAHPTPRLSPPRLVLTRLANIMTLRDELGLILATVGSPARAVAVSRRGIRTPIAQLIELSEKGGVNL